MDIKDAASNNDIDQDIDENQIAEDEAILESMDIDNEFNCWTSFNAPTNNNDPSSKSNEIKEQKLIANEKEILNRDEIYSNFYKPNEKEQKAIKDLAEKLGFKTGRWKFQNNQKEESHAVCLLNLGDESSAKSIILKKGSVLCNGDGREMILLTHGMILAKPEEKGFNLFSGRCFVCAEELKDIACIIDHNCMPKDEEEYNPTALTIKFSDEKQWSLICPSESDKNRWIYALNKSVIPTLTRTLDAEKRIKGWQHSIIHNSLFSAAVIGDVKMLEHMHSLHPKNLNDIDEYGCTALHYSIMYNHLDCIKFLLDNFADFMIKTSSGTTVVELADGTEAQSLLAEYKINSRTVPSSQSILFEQAKKAQDHHNADDKKKDSVLKKMNTATKTVSSTMMEGMSNLMKRGEKLAKLETQTAQLKDDAEEYKNLAGDLKEKMKKKSNNIFGL